MRRAWLRREGRWRLWVGPELPPWERPHFIWEQQRPQREADERAAEERRRIRAAGGNPLPLAIPQPTREFRLALWEREYKEREEKQAKEKEEEQERKKREREEEEARGARRREVYYSQPVLPPYHPELDGPDPNHRAPRIRGVNYICNQPERVVGVVEQPRPAGRGRSRIISEETERDLRALLDQIQRAKLDAIQEAPLDLTTRAAPLDLSEQAGPAQGGEEEKASEEDDGDVLSIDCEEWSDQEPPSLPPNTRIKARLPPKQMPPPKSERQL